MTKALLRIVLSACVLTIFAAPRADAQQFPAVRILREFPNGYLAEVGGELMAIIKQEFADSIGSWQIQLKTLREVNALQQRALAAHARADSAQQKARGDGEAFIQELKVQLTGYKELAEGYKKLNTARTLSLEGGFGASGSDTKPAIVFGLGWSRVRLWTLLQERNVGGFVGANFPIF